MPVIRVSVEGHKRGFDKYLEKLSRIDPYSDVYRLGIDIKSSLQRHSPKDTHEMANSWTIKVVRQGKGKYSLEIGNIGHPETPESVPHLIQYGHGIKGGGYVRANPFITRAMNSVYDAEISRILSKIIDD